MSIYYDLINAVDKGKKFKIDLKNKSLLINKKEIIKEGVLINDKETLIESNDLYCTGWELNLNENPWDIVEFLYQKYKHSVPKEKSKGSKSYFKGLDIDDLSDEEIAFNINRDLGQAILEGYLLCASLIGWLKWEEKEHWFWQCSNDKELVILKDWISQEIDEV